MTEGALGQVPGIKSREGITAHSVGYVVPPLSPIPGLGENTVMRAKYRQGKLSRRSIRLSAFLAYESTKSSADVTDAVIMAAAPL